jgi:general secretion pathway protein D
MRTLPGTCGPAWVLMLASCTHAPVIPTASQPHDAVAAGSGVTELPAETQAPARHEPNLFPGSGELVGSAPTQSVPPAATQGEGFQLQFVEADIPTVVAAVIGEALGAPYTVDPGVKGTITLQSTRPLGKAELLSALETALNTQGFALLNANGGYRVAAVKDAARAATGLRNASGTGKAGYGIQIVPLQYVGAADMQRTLEPFAPTGGILRVDESRNLLVLAGNGPEIAQMLDVVKTFDVDWLSGMSFALFNLNYVDAKTLTGELSEIFADPHSPLHGIVRLVSIPRLNSILVITPQKKYLSDVETWVKRLDLGGSSPGRRIYVYEVQNSKAGDLAKALNRILSLSSGDAGSDTNAPGSRFSGGSGFAPPGGGGVPGNSQGMSFGAPAGTATSPTGAFTGALAPRDAVVDTGAIRIVPDDESNALLIMASPSDFRTVEAALKRLDVPARQVLIEASLAEVTLTKDLQYGVQWSYLTGVGPVVQSADGTISQQFPGLSFLYSGSQSIKAVLNSIETLTKVRVLSNPKLLVLNNHEAELEVGDQVPVATQSAVGTITPNAPIVNSVAYRDTGVILHITPRVNQSGMVQLDIDQEVSDVSPTTTSGINSPTINQRKFSTTVSARSDETVALGGLISDTTTVNKSGVPFLSRIPIFGALFGSHSTQGARTELIVLITPHVIRNVDESRDTMEMLRREFKTLSDLLPREPTGK